MDTGLRFGYTPPAVKKKKTVVTTLRQSLSYEPVELAFGTSGLRGLATDAARELLRPGRADRLFACGPSGMLDALADMARAACVPAELSREAYLRCGVGACGSCAHGDRLVCLDGPVFEVAP